MTFVDQTSALEELETLADILQNQFTPNCKALFSLGVLPTALDCRLLIERITIRILDKVNEINCDSQEETELRAAVRDSAYALIDLLSKRAREANEEVIMALREDFKDANSHWINELQRKFDFELKPQLVHFNFLKQRVHNEILEPLRMMDKTLLADGDLIRCYDMQGEAYNLVHGDAHEGMI